MSKIEPLSEAESFILSEIREGKADSIIIRFKKGKPIVLERVKEKKIKGDARLSEILRKDKYQELEIKTQAGHITYANLKTKTKLGD